jgi:hypothetical protein
MGCDGAGLKPLSVESESRRQGAPGAREGPCDAGDLVESRIIGIIGAAILVQQRE